MKTADIFGLYASYNGWFNDKLFALLLQEDVERYTGEQLDLFGAILRQLNHVFVMDVVWLHRFRKSLAASGAIDDCFGRLPPPPRFMEQILFLQVRDMQAPRAELDRTIVDFSGLLDGLLDAPVLFQTIADREVIERPLWSLLLHLFNHQSLHRGEIIGLAERIGINLGATDILPLTSLISPSPGPSIGQPHATAAC